MKNIMVKPVAYTKNSRNEIIDDNWGEIISEITLTEEFSEDCLTEIETFSHLEIIFYFNKSTNVISGCEHPRENPLWPKVGIFAQRKKDRPNHLGSTIVKLIKKEGKTLTVSNFDAINNTPVLDIKPVFKEYFPNEKIIQPFWSTELMADYW